MGMLDGLRVVFLEALSFADEAVRKRLVEQWNEQCQAVYEYKKALIAEEHYKHAHSTEAEQKTDWISVSERSPEANTRVLGYSRLLDEVCCYDIAEGTREIQWWTEDHGWYLASALDITHWMPLPEPPKGV